MPVVIYLVAVFFWEWLLGHFIELNILYAEGFSDVLLAIFGLFIADFLAAAILKSDERALVCLLIIIYFGYSVYGDMQNHFSFLEAAILEYETLIMMIAAICAVNSD